MWLFNKVPWFFNYSATGQITAPERTVFGIAVTGPSVPAYASYLFCLAFVVLLAWLMRNLTRGKVGRQWMAIRDMDIAAELIGVRPLLTKLSAFAVSGGMAACARRCRAKLRQREEGCCGSTP